MEYIIKSGAYSEAVSNGSLSKMLKGRGGFSLTKAVLAVLAENTCCAKNITADEITTTSITSATGSFSTSISVNTISEYTAATGVTVDGVKLKDGGVTANDMVAAFYPVGVAQAISGAGAVNVTKYATNFTSTGGANALTLANGTQIGQMKKVYHIVDGGSGVLTPTSLTGGTTITFTTAGETALLQWSGTAWGVLDLFNTTAAGASPVLA